MYLNKRKRREKRIRIALIAKVKPFNCYISGVFLFRSYFQRRKQRANRFQLLVEEILKGVAAITSYKCSSTCITFISQDNVCYVYFVIGQHPLS